MSWLAEKNVIGAIIMEPECISKVSNILSPEMFTDETLGLIYAEYLKAYEQRYEINLVVLDQKVNPEYPRDVLNQAIKDCLNSTTTSAYVKSYADVVINSYKAKKCNDILLRTKLNDDNIDDQIAKLTAELESITANKEIPAVTVADMTEKYEDVFFTDRRENEILLGFPKLDDVIGGLDGGDMIVIGARPSTGKSAFVIQVASNLADQGLKIGFYSLEMTEEQMYERCLAYESGIEMQRIRRAVSFLNDEEEKFRKATQKLRKRKNLYVISGSKAMSEIRAESRHMDYDLIIIDYLQLLKPESVYKGNRVAEVGAISHSIKNLALELNIPIIALSQMNRESEMRDSKEPTMAELREAGDIEHDASVIVLLWNMNNADDDGYPHNDTHTKKGCKVEKNRQGKTGRVIMNFDGEHMRFTETSEKFKEDQRRTQQKKKSNYYGSEDIPF